MLTYASIPFLQNVTVVATNDLPPIDFEGHVKLNDGVGGTIFFLIGVQLRYGDRKSNGWCPQVLFHFLHL